MPYIVFTTTDNVSEAEWIGERILDERLGGCVNIVPKIKSIFRWEGKIEKTEETLLIIKTTDEKLDELETRIGEIHSYENPEFLAISVDKGEEDYLEWLRESVK
ncbi:hypothetical protein AKJ55_01630 [candidate division MSBL1 archaeon SCGC-AAA382M17]|uniref:Divalent-cation tolerance protein CutA n=1 Tax=candidate division MSBL1 archaeon SCGC-AAA382M17 TaxID=1698284 RepID=A0ABR5TJG1_9EURY|nr:hypothetical protein AKJ55_01630 [candidate division MSBL1 archaeon SCGC-AAA382M17]